MLVNVIGKQINRINKDVEWDTGKKSTLGRAGRITGGANYRGRPRKASVRRSQLSCALGDEKVQLHAELENRGPSLEVGKGVCLWNKTRQEGWSMEGKDRAVWSKDIPFQSLGIWVHDCTPVQVSSRRSCSLNMMDVVTYFFLRLASTTRVEVRLLRPLGVNRASAEVTPCPWATLTFSFWYLEDKEGTRSLPLWVLWFHPFIQSSFWEPTLCQELKIDTWKIQFVFPVWWSSQAWGVCISLSAWHLPLDYSEGRKQWQALGCLGQTEPWARAAADGKPRRDRATVGNGPQILCVITWDAGYSGFFGWKRRGYCNSCR